MKSIVAASVFACSMLLLGGCSTMHDSTLAVHPQNVEDQLYVARVEQAARDRGVMVRWINPPDKHVAGKL